MVPRIRPPALPRQPCHLAPRPAAAASRASSLLPSRRRRHLSSSSSSTGQARPATAAEAAAQLLEGFSGQQAVRRQLLDGNQAQKLCLALGRRVLWPSSFAFASPADEASDPPPPPDGTPLPPGYHLVYFTPGGVEAELGPDGTDRTFNAPAPFSRRMWAGGAMAWAGGSGSGDGGGDVPVLRVGDVVEEHTQLLSAVPKRSRDGAEMVLVEVEKQYVTGSGGLALTDRRSWVFRPELKAAVEPIAEPVEGKVIRGPSIVEDERVEGQEYPQRRLRWSPVGLFRFSALTFNGHKIHYDESWTRSVESHPAQVVHGPLNLISMLDYWRDVHGPAGVGKISYRAMSPLYAGDTYHIRTSGVPSTADGVFEILVQRDAVTCMKASIESSNIRS